MANYVVTVSEIDDDGTPPVHKTRPEAELHFEQIRTTGKFVRMIRWDEGNAVEVARANDRRATRQTPRLERRFD